MFKYSSNHSDVCLDWHMKDYSYNYNCKYTEHSTPLVVSCILHSFICLDKKVLIYGIELRPNSRCYWSMKETHVLDMTGASVALKPLKMMTSSSSAANDTNHCFCNDTSPFLDNQIHRSSFEQSHDGKNQCWTVHRWIQFKIVHQNIRVTRQIHDL